MGVTSEPEPDGARNRLLAMSGCPTAQRVSAPRMARIAFTAGIASMGWAIALAMWVENTGPNPVADLTARVLLVYAGPLLMAVLPSVAAWSVFALRSPMHRFLTACACLPFAFATAFAVESSMYQWAHAYTVPMTFAHVVSELFNASPAAGLVAALVGLPLAPALFFGRPGVTDDHAMRARFRIGLSVIVASLLQLACLLYFIPHSTVSEPRGYLCLIPPVMALAFGLFEAVKARLVLASLRRWLTRVREGAVHGIRVRVHEPADAALHVPDLVTSPPVALADLDDLEVLEAYADEADAGPYRRKQSAVPIARLPRR